MAGIRGASVSVVLNKITSKNTWEEKERKKIGNILFQSSRFKSQRGSLSSRHQHDARSRFYCHDKKNNNFEPIRAADENWIKASNSKSFTIDLPREVDH